MSALRRKFTSEFKHEAVALAPRSGRSAHQGTQEVGVSQTALRHWLREATRAASGPNGFPAGEARKALRREMERLRMERDLLKKAAAFFANESRGALPSFRRRRRKILWRCWAASWPWRAAGSMPGVNARGADEPRSLRPYGRRFAPLTRSRMAGTGVRACTETVVPRDSPGAVGIEWRGCCASMDFEVAAVGVRPGDPPPCRRRCWPRTYYHGRSPRPRHTRHGQATAPLSRLGKGGLSVAVRFDWYARRVVGWALGARIPTAVTHAALTLAVPQRQVVRPLLHHSDRGSQYTAGQYHQGRTRYGLPCSMSRPSIDEGLRAAGITEDQLDALDRELRPNSIR
jgi:transposase